MRVLTIIALLGILVVTSIGAAKAPNEGRSDKTVSVQPAETELLARIASGSTGV